MSDSEGLVEKEQRDLHPGFGRLEVLIRLPSLYCNVAHGVYSMEWVSDDPGVKNTYMLGLLFDLELHTNKKIQDVI